jgi:transposase-like protein
MFLCYNYDKMHVIIFETMDCPKCESKEFCKDGIVKGKQRYLCKKCRYRYTVIKKSDVADKTTKRQALHLYLEGLGFRSIGRLLNYSNVTILKWIRSFGEKLEEIKNDDHPVQVMEIDEMHTYIGQKKTIVGYGLLPPETEKNSSISHWVAGELVQGNNFGIK